jgi:RecB family exonuclease
MPQEGPFAKGREADELVDADFPPDLRGRIFHATMESIDRLTLTALPSEIQRLLAIEVAPHTPHFAQLVEEVHRMVTGVVSSPFWQQVEGGTDARTEFTISAVLGDDYLSGTMDRVYRGSDGRWHVLDYKTDRVDASTVAGRAEEYWPQLEFYALLVHRFFNCAPVMAELLFAAMPHHVLRREYSSEGLADARQGIAAVIARIKSNTFPPRLASCAKCPFASGCPWNRHGS